MTWTYSLQTRPRESDWSISAMVRALKRIRQRHARKLNHAARTAGHLDRAAWRLPCIVNSYNWQAARRPS